MRKRPNSTVHFPTSILLLHETVILGRKYAELNRQNQPAAPVAAPAATTTDEGAQGGKKKKEKEKKPAAPKEEPVVDPAEVVVEDEADEILAAEPKQKDPFAEMPKSNLNMDEFKRVYSNQDTATVAIPYFWDHFDKENCSIWFCEYKYPDELTQVFMTCNLISGFFQRLDKLRKNAFASMCVLGENNNNTITGIWIWRGHELAFKVSIFTLTLLLLSDDRICSCRPIGKSITNRTTGDDWMPRTNRPNKRSTSISSGKESNTTEKNLIKEKFSNKNIFFYRCSFEQK